MPATSLPFDFFRGLARRIAGPRAPVRHVAAPAPLSALETLLYVGLVTALTVGLGGVAAHHRSFMLGRVATEEAERRNSPELFGQLIHEQDRVVGVSIQRVFDIALVPPRAAPEPDSALDGALAAARQAPANTGGGDDEVPPVALQRTGTWRARSR